MLSETELVITESNLVLYITPSLTPSQVKIWFQNRRNKWKRQLAADMEAANLAGGGGRVVPPHPHPHQPSAQVHPLYMPHLAIKTVHQTLGVSGSPSFLNPSVSISEASASSLMFPAPALPHSSVATNPLNTPTSSLPFL